ncbi:MAG: hypothetical protein EON87_00885 [Brevundimonas sp.]|nr:MAG: hypothetical protein EON87_00885 [Brevundimonas sp.]
MDLASLDTADLANQGMVMQVHSPLGPVWVEDENGDPTDVPVTITLLGDDSDLMQKFDRASVNQSFRAGQVLTAEISEAKAINRAARATVGWSGVTLDGEALTFSEENAKRLYKRFRWLRAGVQQFVSDRANFLNASPKG